MTILSLDPGTVKCGLAALSSSGDGPPSILRRAVIPTGETITQAVAWAAEFGASAILIGDATGGAPFVRALRERFGDAVSVRVVRERGTSERARARYFVENPPPGWKRVIPVGLLTPPVPYDDYAAVILAEDWLAAQSEAG